MITGLPRPYWLRSDNLRYLQQLHGPAAYPIGRTDRAASGIAHFDLGNGACKRIDDVSDASGPWGTGGIVGQS